MANIVSEKDVNEVKQLVVNIWEKDINAGSEAIVNLAEEYRAKYADWAKCHLYHVMIMSTPSGAPDFADFPGDDSVIARLRNILDGI